MSKVNIDLGASTSFGLSASASVTAGAHQETAVGFDSTTKFLFQCGLNLSLLNLSCSYSTKEWLITGKLYRSTGSFAKFATKSIDAGCKSFFSGGEDVNISSKDKVTFISSNAIKVRVDRQQLPTELAGDACGVLLLHSSGTCKIEKCTDIGISIGAAQVKKCVCISKSDSDMAVSLYDDKVKLNSNSGVNIFDNAVSVGAENVSWFDNVMEAQEDNVNMINLKSKPGLVRVADTLRLAE